jgi:hypothetical protein
LNNTLKLFIDAHREEGEGKYGNPQANFNILSNKNAINPKIRPPPSPEQFFLKGLTHQGFWQKLELRSPLDLQPVCIYEIVKNSFKHF